MDASYTLQSPDGAIENSLSIAGDFKANYLRLNDWTPVRESFDQPRCHTELWTG